MSQASRRFDELYRVKSRDNLGSPDYWNRRFSDLDRRIFQNEQALEDVDAVANRVESVALDRVNNIITPLVVEARERLTSVTTIFEATSKSTLSINLEPIALVVDMEDRPTFAPLPYVYIFPTGDMNAFMAGRLISYDRQSGELHIDVLRLSGEGEYSDWQIGPVVLSSDLDALAAQVQAWAEQVSDDRAGTEAAAGVATTQAGIATAARGDAVGAAGVAVDARDDAIAARDAAEGYRDEAAALLGFDIADYQALDKKNAADGYAGLGADGKISDGLLPASVAMDAEVSATYQTKAAAEAAQEATDEAIGEKAPKANPSFTGVVKLANGAVATPALTFAGDTNTGLFWVSADVMALVVGGVEKLRIDSTGIKVTGAVTATGDVKGFG